MSRDNCRWLKAATRSLPMLRAKFFVKRGGSWFFRIGCLLRAPSLGLSCSGVGFGRCLPLFPELLSGDLTADDLRQGAHRLLGRLTGIRLRERRNDLDDQLLLDWCGHSGTPLRSVFL